MLHALGLSTVSSPIPHPPPPIPLSPSLLMINTSSTDAGQHHQNVTPLTDHIHANVTATVLGHARHLQAIQEHLTVPWRPGADVVVSNGREVWEVGTEDLHVEKKVVSVFSTQNFSM